MPGGQPLLDPVLNHLLHDLRMLAGVDGHRWRARQRMRVHGDRFGLVVAEDVFINLLGFQRIPPLVVAKQPESGCSVVLVVGDGQVLPKKS